MAKNKVEIDVKVDDKGTTKKVGLSAKKAGKGLDDVGRSARTADRNLKGAAQASSNTTKNFSKMAQGTGGLVAAYATLAANIFAISAAYGFLKRAGDLVALTRGQEAYAQTTGKSMKLLTSRMQEATGGLLAFDEASQAAAIGTAAGISSDQLEGLARIAKNASVALGRDLTDSFNRLTKGAIKAEPELLDELGIVLRLEKASGDYARALGKNAKDLTTFEKSQAVVNAVLEQGNEKFDDVGDNVNQIARLGKSFDDLVKKVSKAIEPVASFFAGALADNVEALAAAFGVLGLSISRALIPAGPQLAKFSDMAAGAKERLMASAGTGKLGQNIAAGNIGARELTAIDKGADVKSGTSTVIDQSNMTKKQFKRDVAIMRADHARMVAANTTGFKKYTANVKAYLLGMQAEHGRVMGSMKAAGAAMAAGMSKVLNAVAIIGMISLAITMIKEFIEYFKDPALKALETQARSMKDRYAEQNTEIGNLIANFEAAGTGAENLVKQANVLSNFSFIGVKQMAESLKKSTETRHIRDGAEQYAGGFTAGQIIGVDPEENKIQAASIEEVSKSLRVQMSALADFNIVNEATAAQQNRLIQITNDLNTLNKGSAKDQEGYNEAIVSLQLNLKEAAVAARTFSTLLAPQKAAVHQIGQTIEGFDKFRAKMKHSESQYNTFIGFNEQLTDSLKQFEKQSGKKKMGEFFTANEVAAYSSILGLSAKDLTINETKIALMQQAEKIRSQEFAIEQKSLHTQINFVKNSRKKTKLQQAYLVRENEISKVSDSILKIEQQIEHHRTLGATEDSTKITKLRLQQQILQEQLDTAKELNNQGTQLEMAFKNAFESSMSTNIADLIKGQESSIKDAMMNIAKAALEAVADKLSEQITLGVTDFIFGKDPAIVAQQANTTALTSLTAAITSKLPAGAAGAGVVATTAVPKVAGVVTTTAVTETGAEMAEVVTTGSKKAVIPFVSAFGDFFANFKTGELSLGESLKGLFTDIGVDFKGIFDGFGDMFGSMFEGLFGGGEGGGIMSSIFTGISSMFGGASARNGGVFSAGQKVQGYSTGGIAKGSTSGYPATLHGTEAVVPLPNGNSIPVQMQGNTSQQNNVVVNVSTDGSTKTESSSGMDGDKLGRAVAAAVQAELHNQKRSGGILNPYGVA